MSTVSLLTLANEIDLLFADYNNIEDAFFCLSAISGYENVHDAPQCVQDAETDITYLDSTLKIIEEFFGATNHSFNLPNAKHILSLHVITIPLEKHLKDLHAVLQTWPNPPTVKATETFDKKHSRTVGDLGKKIRESQLQVTRWLSESTLLPSSLDADLQASANEHGRDEEFQSENGAGWGNLNDLLQTIPPTLHLSHLVTKLEELRLATSKTQLPQLTGFSEDVKQIKEVVKMLDQRLLVENHFDHEVRYEINRIADVAIKLLLHELKVLPPLSRTSELNYEDLPLHHFLKDHHAIFGMILTFLAGVRETEGKEEHEQNFVVVSNEKNQAVETVRDEFYEDAVAAILQRIAIHSGAANTWCEARKHLEK